VVGYLWLSFYDIHIRYRLTVEVQDGDQIKTGSSVIEASYSIQPDYLSAYPNTYARIDGYAPTVDLGEKGMLFLTFSNAMRSTEGQAERNKQVFCPFTDIGCLPFAAYHKSGKSNDSGEKQALLRELLRQSGPREVPFIVLPELARFVDADGQHELVQVSPYDLAASFGPGVQLKRVILQLTNASTTPQPQVWPRWLKESGKMYVGILS
jgi:hypothetical protein